MEDKKINVVPGNGKDLNISPVYDHISAEQPKKTGDKPKNIVIPETKK